MLVFVLPFSLSRPQTALAQMDLGACPKPISYDPAVLSLPTPRSGLTSLQTLTLGPTNVRGTLPPSYSALTNLQVFSAKQNSLHGSLPQVTSRGSMQGTSRQVGGGEQGKMGARGWAMLRAGSDGWQSGDGAQLPRAGSHRHCICVPDTSGQANMPSCCCQHPLCVCLAIVVGLHAGVLDAHGADYARAR